MKELKCFRHLAIMKERDNRSGPLARMNEKCEIDGKKGIEIIQTSSKNERKRKVKSIKRQTDRHLATINEGKVMEKEGKNS